MPGSPHDGFSVSVTVLEFNMFVSETEIDYNIWRLIAVIQPACRNLSIIKCNVAEF